MTQTVDAPDRQRPATKATKATRPTRLWVLLEALGYAGAFIDPTGLLAAQRFRRAEQEERRHGR
jgi:hypothetical protein